CKRERWQARLCLWCGRLRIVAAIGKVTHPMPLAPAAPLEASGRAWRLQNPAILVADVGKQWMRIEYAALVGGIVFPVGGQAADAIGREDAGDGIGKPRLDDASLVVAFLGPGIGEIQQYRIKRGRCKGA